MCDTLIISRKRKLHKDYIGYLEAKGFSNVAATDAGRNGLCMKINEVKPQTMIIDVEFFKCASCYMIRDLIKKYNGIDFVAVSFMEFPAAKGMWLIVNGVKSYLNINEGIEQFRQGIDFVRTGKQFISADVKERYNRYDAEPFPASDIVDKEYEIWRLMCCGFIEGEIAEALNLSEISIKKYKSSLFNNLGVRNDKEAVSVAYILKKFNEDELMFYGGKYGFRVKPQIDLTNRRVRK